MALINTRRLPITRWLAFTVVGGMITLNALTELRIVLLLTWIVYHVGCNHVLALCISRVESFSRRFVGNCDLSHWVVAAEELDAGVTIGIPIHILLIH